MLDRKVHNFYFSNQIPVTQQNLTALHNSVHVLNFKITSALEKLNRMSREGYGMRFAPFWDITQRMVVIMQCMVVRNYHRTLRNIPEERRSHLLRGRSLKSRMECFKVAHHPAVHLQILRQVMKSLIQKSWRY
jgi:hypothetical protein